MWSLFPSYKFSPPPVLRRTHHGQSRLRALEPHRSSPHRPWSPVWRLWVHLAGRLDFPPGTSNHPKEKKSNRRRHAETTNGRPQVPQLIENYRQSSADGISLAFLVVWFIGDITNLAGAIWAGLVPTVIALAVYFCFADLVLITQCLYYNIINARKARRNPHRPDLDSPEQPLLSRRDSSIGLPGSHRRKSSAASRRNRDSINRRDSLASILEEETGSKQWVKNSISIIGICIIGAAGWAIAWKTGVWKPTPTDNDAAAPPVAFGAKVLGYASAVCYLGARIPQIIKNQRDRSCEGLSLLFFILSLLGNATYGAGVGPVHSPSHYHIC
jgi:solute carrier family 66 (lysosomal lysine-arginine transporter), member 1